MNASSLGQIRTGAASGIATRYLSKQNSTNLSIIGTGYQAKTQAQAIAAIRPITLIKVYSRSLENRNSFAKWIEQNLNIECIPVTSPEDCIEKSDIILLGVSRTSKTPTSIYLANRGYKTSNIPLINENSIPELLRENPKLKCVVGLTVEPKRLIDVRKNRMIALKEEHGTDYTNIEKIELETESAKKAFKKAAKTLCRPPKISTTLSPSILSITGSCSPLPRTGNVLIIRCIFC